MGNIQLNHNTQSFSHKKWVNSKEEGRKEEGRKKLREKEKGGGGWRGLR